MRKIIFGIMLLGGQMAFAQFGGLSMQAPSRASSENTGFYLGADYLNVTDFSADLKVSAYGMTESFREEGGQQVGMAGLRAGYSSVPSFGPGFEVGLRYLETYSKNTDWDPKLTITMPEANLVVAFSSFFNLYLGVNTAFFDGSKEARYYKPNIGGQAGIGIRPFSSISVNLGYVAIREKYEEVQDGASLRGDVTQGGFNANLNYIF